MSNENIAQNLELDSKVNGKELPNALQRVSKLPLLLSTYDAFKSYYVSLKKSYPTVTPYLEAAEGITNAAANLAITSSQPVVDKYGNTLNSYANCGLDKLEDKIPQLQKPAHQVFEDTKDKASDILNELLGYTENIVDYYLPEEDQQSLDASDSASGEEDDSCHGNKIEGTKKRLTGISAKVKKRSYQRAMRRLSFLSGDSKANLSGLDYTVNLIKLAQNGLTATTNTITHSVNNVHQKITTAKEGITTAASAFSEKWESKVLANAEKFSKQLMETCSKYFAYFQTSEKYQNLLEKASKAKDLSKEVYKTFAGVNSISNLSSVMISTTQNNINQLNQLLLTITDKLVDYPPLNWLESSESDNQNDSNVCGNNEQTEST